MRIAETKNIEEIKRILFDDDIWKRTGANYTGKGDFLPPTDIDGLQYIAGYVDDEIIGLAIYHKDGDRLKVHFQVLPEHRRKYAVEFARLALNVGKAKNTPIYAEIPECYPEVIGFAEKFDFKVVSVEKAGEIVDGIPYDVQLLRRDNVRIKA